MAAIRRTVEALPEYDGCYDITDALQEAIKRTSDKAKAAEYRRMLRILPALNAFFAGLDEVRSVRKTRDDWSEPVYG
jgi:hypothetical protein